MTSICRTSSIAGGPSPIWWSRAPLKASPAGRVIKDVVAREVASLVQVGLVTQIPDVNSLFDNAYFDAVHDSNGKVIWPGPIKQ